MKNEQKKKKGLWAMVREAFTKTGGCCCGPGETCCGPSEENAKGRKDERGKNGAEKKAAQG